MDSIVCEGCGKELWIGAEICPDCGTALQPGTEADAHLYKSRVAIFEPLLDRSREPVPTSVVPVTDPQYLRYILGTDLLDAAPLSETTEIANALKLETPPRSAVRRTGRERSA